MERFLFIASHMSGMGLFLLVWGIYVLLIPAALAGFIMALSPRHSREVTRLNRVVLVVSAPLFFLVASTERDLFSGVILALGRGWFFWIPALFSSGALMILAARARAKKADSPASADGPGVPPHP